METHFIYNHHIVGNINKQQHSYSVFLKNIYSNKYREFGEVNILATGLATGLGKEKLAI